MEAIGLIRGRGFFLGFWEYWGAILGIAPWTLGARPLTTVSEREAAVSHFEIDRVGAPFAEREPRAVRTGAPR